MSRDKTQTTIQAGLWAAVKSARDAAVNRLRATQDELDQLNDLLARMTAAGMNSHLPTIEQVQAANMQDPDTVARECMDHEQHQSTVSA